MSLVVVLIDVCMCAKYLLRAWHPEQRMRSGQHPNYFNLLHGPVAPPPPILAVVHS